MFLFETTDGDKLRVFFRYDREHVPAKPNKKNSKPHVRPVGTTCLICKAGDKATAGIGHAVKGIGHARCHYTDHFVYKSGRKHALRRALANMKLDRASRKNAWDKLLSM